VASQWKRKQRDVTYLERHCVTRVTPFFNRTISASLEWKNKLKPSSSCRDMRLVC
jgi:hypothetical protein